MVLGIDVNNKIANVVQSRLKVLNQSEYLL